jgi:hypothetical protein
MRTRDGGVSRIDPSSSLTQVETGRNLTAASELRIETPMTFAMYFFRTVPRQRRNFKNYNFISALKENLGNPRMRLSK